jgi:hypothetical protein
MAGLYEDEILGAQQQRDLARKLRDTEVPSTGHMIGDWYVAPTVAQQLSAVLKQGIGAYKENQAEDEIKGLKQERARSSADAFSQMGMQAPSGLLAEAGTPAVKPSIMDRLGAALTFNAQPKGTPAQPYQQTIAQNVTAPQSDAAMLSLMSSNPELGAGAIGLSNTRAVREATATEKAYQHLKDKTEQDWNVKKFNQQQEFQSSQREQDRALKESMAQLALSNRQPPQAEMPVAIMGANGQPTYVSRSQAMGQVPYTATTAKQDAQDVAKEEQKTQATLSAQQVLDNGANMLLHPGRSMATGASGVLPTIPGTDARDFEARLNTYKAETFVPMVSALKGMGALSDAEGKKLTESVGALERTMSEKGFEDSLKETNKFLFDKAKAAGLNVQMPSGLDVHSKADAILGIK